MGGEREPVMCAALFSILTGVSGASSGKFIVIGIALAFYFFAVMILRKLAKADPVMTKVWTRHIAYRHYYAARSHYWPLKCYRKK